MIKILSIVLLMFIPLNHSLAEMSDQKQSAVIGYCSGLAIRLKDIVGFRDSGIDRKDVEESYIQAMIKNDYVEEFFVEMLLWIVVAYNRPELNPEEIQKQFVTQCYEHFGMGE